LTEPADFWSNATAFVRGFVGEICPLLVRLEELEARIVEDKIAEANACAAKIQAELHLREATVAHEALGISRSDLLYCLGQELMAVEEEQVQLEASTDMAWMQTPLYKSQLLTTQSRVRTLRAQQRATIETKADEESERLREEWTHRYQIAKSIYADSKRRLSECKTQTADTTNHLSAAEQNWRQCLQRVELAFQRGVEVHYASLLWKGPDKNSPSIGIEVARASLVRHMRELFELTIGKLSGSKSGPTDMTIEAALRLMAECAEIKFAGGLHTVLNLSWCERRVANFTIMSSKPLG